MGQGVDQGFTERARLHIGDRHAKQAGLHLLLADPGEELLLDPLEQPHQRPAVEVVHANVGAVQDLEGRLVGWYVLAQGRFAADQQQAGERGACSPLCRADETQRPVQLGVVQAEQCLVAAVAFDGLAQAMALGRIERVRLGPGDDRRGIIG